MSGNDSNNRPKVGVGALIFKDEKILLAKRKGSHGEGEYACVGGHMEYGESFVEALKRECLEECGIKIKNIRFLCLINTGERYAPKHYVDIGLIADWQSGKPSVKEPHKHEKWEWHELENPPKPLFWIDECYLKAYKTGQKFFDS